MTQLVDIPIGGEIRQIDHTHICAVSLYLLCVPEGECVIVAVSEYYGTRLKRTEIVHAEIACGITSGTVVVVPCLWHHLKRDKYTEQSGYDSTNPVKPAHFLLWCLGIGNSGNQTPDTGHTHSYPYSECVEWTGKRVVALTGLVGDLIEIYYDSDTGHEEQEEYHPELFDTAPWCKRLPQEAYYAQQQREHEEYIVAFVATAEVFGQKRLVAKTGIIDKWYAWNPVAVGNLSVALDIILPAGEVPHEISPVHMIELRCV